MKFDNYLIFDRFKNEGVVSTMLQVNVLNLK